MDEEEKNVEEIKTTGTNVNPEKKGFNITSLVLGIISVVFFCIWYVSLPSGIIAIIFSIAGKKDAGRGMGVAGLVLGIIGLVLCLIIWLYAILIVGAATNSILSY